MNNKVANFLKTILGEYKDYNDFEFYYVCPFCQHRDKKKKLAINLDKNRDKRVQKLRGLCDGWRTHLHFARALKDMAVTDWSPTKRQRLLINSHLLPLGITFPYGIRCGSDKEPGK